jgi:hypothetical protein
MVLMKKYEYAGFFVVGLLCLIIGWVFINNDTSYGILNLFIPMNSSLWEVGKLMFVSLLIYAIFEYFVFGNKYGNFWFAKAAGMLFGPLIYVFFSYVADVAIGNSYTLVHIIIFALCIAIAQYISYNFMQHELYFKLMNAYGVIAIIILFTIFSMYNERSDRLSGAIFEPMDEYTKTINFM